MSNGKRFLTLAAVVLMSAACCMKSVQAEGIYLVIAADTNDERIGRGVSVNVDNLEKWFCMFVPARNLSIRKVTGRNFSKRGILSAVNRMDPGENDGLVVIVCCHGGYNDSGHYLSMPRGANLYRRALVGTVCRQGAGTDVVITDACNVSIGPPAGAFALKGIVRQPREIATLFRSLFLDARGLVDINGAARDQYTFIHARAGGYFINVFGGALVRHANETMSWNQCVGLLDSGLRDVYGDYGITDSRTNYVQYKQTVGVWHLPPGWPGRGGGASNRGGAIPRTLSLSRGDVILSINGQNIKGRASCIRAVNSSPRTMTFTVRDSRDGTVWRMQTELRSSGYRFGVDLRDNPGGGAYVTSVSQGYPATRNRVLGRNRKL